MLDNATSPTAVPPPVPAAESTASDDGGARELPVNREPLLPAEPAPAPVPGAPQGHQLSRPEPELLRSLEDGVQARIDKAVAAAEARVRAELTTPQPQAQAGQATAREPDPALVDYSRAQLGPDTSDDLIQRYAGLAEDRALWTRAQRDPQHADKAPAALRQIEDQMRALQTTAYVERQQRAERQASTGDAAQQPQLPSTVGEFCDNVRQNVTPEYVAEHYPALGAAIAQGTFTVSQFIDKLQLHTAASPELALERLQVALDSTAGAYQTLAAQAPVPAKVPGDPAITTPTTPSPGGHASRANAASMADYEARVNA